MKTLKLYQHQKKHIRKFIAEKKLLNFSQVGTGKTLVAIKSIDFLDMEAVILCPAYLRKNWEREINSFSVCPQGSYLIETEADILGASHAKIVVCSYSQLEHLELIFSQKRVLIVDEAHYLKNLKSRRSRYFFSFIKKYPPSHIMLMTGTPVRKHIPDVFPLLAAINPDGFLNKFDNYYSFAHHFTHARVQKIGSFKTTVFEGFKNQDELGKYLKSCSVRSTIDDVGELPPYIEKTLRLDCDFKNEGALWDVFCSYRDGDRTCENMATAKSFSALKKAPKTSELVHNLVESGESVVVFSDHIEAADMIFSKLEKIGAKLIKGSTSLGDRDKFITQFQAGETPILVGTVRAMGTGVTLTRARICVFNDLPWDLSDLLQAEARIYRISQKRKTLKIICESGPVDARINRILTKKRTVSDGINKLFS